MKLLTKAWQRKIIQGSILAQGESWSTGKWTCWQCAGRDHHPVICRSLGPGRGHGAYPVLRSLVASRGTQVIIWDNSPRGFAHPPVVMVLCKNCFSLQLQTFSCLRNLSMDNECLSTGGSSVLHVWVWALSFSILVFRNGGQRALGTGSHRC